MDQEGSEHIFANVLVILTKTTTAQCLHLMMVSWSNLQFFAQYQMCYFWSIPTSRTIEITKLENIRKEQLSVSMKFGTTFWSIQKLSLIWIFFMIQTTSLETRTEKSLQNPDNPTNKFFTQYDVNVTNNYEKLLEAWMNWDNLFLIIVIFLKIDLQRTKTCIYKIILAN